ncbi:MAG: NAD(P)/FAD-dependent oxidoreductase [Chloroflexota bacterium]
MNTFNGNTSLCVIGAGPAGLAAAYQAVSQQLRPLVLEKSEQVGGLARTVIHSGYRFDIGGHRFYTKVEMVQRLWEEMLGEDFIQVPRLSRIYYRGRFFNYPIELINTLSNLGPWESARILFSYLRAQLQPYPQEETFEQWVSNRFGQRLYETFFKTYTEKVWGIPCDQIRAEWAAQRIMGLSLRTAVTNALFSNHNGDAKSLINQFYYPRLGPGMMWERFAQAVEARCGQVQTGVEVQRLEREGRRIAGVLVRQGGETRRLVTEQVISSMPLNQLIQRLDPPAPPGVLAAADKLKYRDFILVGLALEESSPFPDQWIYVHSPGFKVGRVQNFRNWSAAMTPEADKTSLGLEYFCTRDDELWRLPDRELIELARRELEALGLGRAADVVDGMVVRQPMAYPIYDEEYLSQLAILQDFLSTFKNLQTIGRNGMHRYNNMDHSMLTGMLAVENLLGAQHDLWQVNTERSYSEQQAF